MIFWAIQTIGAIQKMQLRHFEDFFTKNNRVPQNQSIFFRFFFCQTWPSQAIQTIGLSALHSDGNRARGGQRGCGVQTWCTFIKLINVFIHLVAWIMDMTLDRVSSVLNGRFMSIVTLPRPRCIVCLSIEAIAAWCNLTHTNSRCFDRKVWSRTNLGWDPRPDCEQLREFEVVQHEELPRLFIAVMFVRTSTSHLPIWYDRWTF